MPPLQPPDMDPGNLRDLILALHELHLRAGWPSLRDMAKGQSFSYATVHDLFCRPRNRAPKPKVLLDVVASLAPRIRGADVEEILDNFDGLWQKAAVQPFEGLPPWIEDDRFEWMGTGPIISPDEVRRRMEAEEAARKSAEAEMWRARIELDVGNLQVEQMRINADLQSVVSEEGANSDRAEVLRAQLSRVADDLQRARLALVAVSEEADH